MLLNVVELRLVIDNAIKKQYNIKNTKSLPCRGQRSWTNGRAALFVFVVYAHEGYGGRHGRDYALRTN